MAPLVVVSVEDIEYFPLQLPWFKVIRLDQKRSAAKNYCLDQFSVPFPCNFFSLPPPPLKDYPGFQLNQSCLWLEIMSVLAGLQMNTVALGLLQLSAVASCRHFRGRQEKRTPGLRRPIKNTYSNWRSTAKGSNYAPSVQLHFASRFIPIVFKPDKQYQNREERRRACLISGGSNATRK